MKCRYLLINYIIIIGSFFKALTMNSLAIIIKLSMFLMLIMFKQLLINCATINHVVTHL